MTYSTAQFAEKYLLALETTRKDRPSSGLNGLELEWNLLDAHFRPLVTVGSGHARQSFVDFMREACLSPWLRECSQLEVFHWMVEWVTRPFFQPRGAVYEARLMEAALINALSRAGGEFAERLYYWHGNLLFSPAITHDSIPGTWGIAKRRYLERCVDLYGDSLATAGIHVNLSLPDTLFVWDFMRLAAAERGERHLDQYKSEFYITAARTLRAFAALFIATSASTPLQAQLRGKRKVVALTPCDSVRNLTFPNPPEIDQPDLYHSYKEYKRISYNLVRQGVRFGNNNWTPVRARSFAEPVERLISMTGDQLDELYTRGLYSIGEDLPAEEMARQIEQQNLLARINLPMGRVEIRTDDGGHPLEVDVANMTLKHLLLIRIYADPEFAREFRYGRQDIDRARRNEGESARRGLQADIENPFSGEQIEMRSFLKWTLEEIRPLAAPLGMWEDLSPLVEMAAGAPNTADKLRSRLQMELGANDEVPLSLLRSVAEQREAQVTAEVERIAAGYLSLDTDAAKIGQFLGYARDEARQHPDLPVRFRPASGITIESSFPDKSSEIVDLAQHLIRIPSVTACPDERLDEVHRAGTFIFDYLRGHGLEARYFDGKYPAVYATFPSPRRRSGAGEGSGHPILLSGHFDVVEPDPDDSQFMPRIEGDYLWGRGAADMKTVVATYMVWMKDVLRSGKPTPDIAMLLVGNEENGESEAWGTPFVLRELGLKPALLVAGERTGEKGDELYGEICIENRGIMRFEVIIRGQKGHSGVSGAGADLSERLIQARAGLMALFEGQLTLKAGDGWQSQAKFPFINVGKAGIYNITAAEGVLGVEIRPIPQDDIHALRKEVEAYCGKFGLEVSFSVMEDGVACDPRNPALQALLAAAEQSWGRKPKTGKKLPGTSARFAPGGQGVVWGESGIGPHARDERHFIPSIQPYYQALNELANKWK